MVPCARRVYFVALSVAAVVPSTQQASCPPEITGASFPPVAAAKAVTFGADGIDGGDSGSTSTITGIQLTGLDGSGQKSACADSGGSSEFKLSCPAIKLSTGAATCDCSHIAISKSNTSANAEVSMRLDFVNCSSGPKMAFMELGVAKVPDSDSSAVDLVAYMKGTCSQPTTTLASEDIKVSLDVIEKWIGNGTCKANVSHKYHKAQIGTKKACHNQCTSSIMKYVQLDEAKSSAKCKGYAFNANADPSCITYNGTSVSSSDSSSEAGWTCWNVTKTAGTFAESTPRPQTAEEQKAEEAKAPKLVMSPNAASSSLLTISSKTGCFEPFQVFKMVDAAGKKATALSVKTSSWDQFLSMLPNPSAGRRLASSSSVPGTVTVQKVPIGSAPAGGAAPTGGAAQAGGPTGAPSLTPSTAAPAPAPVTVVAEDCVPAEVFNAVITAILVGPLTWLAVLAMHNMCFKDEASRSRADPDKSYDSRPPMSSGMSTAYEDPGEVRGCPMTTTILLVLVALGAAAILSFILAEVFRFILNPMCAASSHDIGLIKMAVGLSVTMTIGGWLLYSAMQKPRGGGPGGRKQRLAYIDEAGQPLKILDDGLG